jgi:hypothetical protein
MTKNINLELIEYEDVEEINHIISEAFLNISSIADEKLNITLDGDLERSIIEIVYGELKASVKHDSV